jgi:CDP-paratose 2-epimerase
LIGTGKQVRDPLYAGDAAQAFMDWFEKGCKSGVYNLGGGEATMISVRQYLQMLKEVFGLDVKIVEPSMTRLGDLHYWVSDCGKAKREFGWEPKTELVDGIQSMLEWLRENIGMFGGR